MSKRKPTEVIVHRIELQQKERELLETAVLMQNANRLIQSISAVDPATLYALLTLAEAFGLVKTPIPTLGDLPENGVINALKTWSQNNYEETARRKEEQGDSPNWAERNLSDQALLARLFGWLDAQSGGATDYSRYA
jgi:hypothetical protein